MAYFPDYLSFPFFSILYLPATPASLSLLHDYTVTIIRDLSDVECRSPAQTTAAGTPSASKRARAAELGFPAADKAQVEDERRKRQERLEHINEQLR